ncbi:hypothetical protein [Brevibacillus sp. DP1.3A]|uniref:hypothetical protein n=1 Tax=Brevibacillus sp. DP1.3A TaxID=2738867 RepID=UPI00156B25BF|nr:hypothetical protein [Brevibacillus sp. DP1.3A]MED1919503.1 hypothetical protein [Bacillus thuringiensis]UED77475.1 hypothetical protein HP399_013735 [Brevibacillus sp. DP1.3A]
MGAGGEFGGCSAGGGSNTGGGQGVGGLGTTPGGGITGFGKQLGSHDLGSLFDGVKQKYLLYFLASGDGKEIIQSSY